MDISNHYYIRDKVAIYIANDSRAMAEVWSMFYSTMPPSSEFSVLVYPNAHLAPVLAPVYCIGRNLVAVWFVSTYIMHIRGHNDFAYTIAIEIGYGGVVIKNTMGIAAVVV